MRYFCIAGGYRWKLFHTSSSGVNSKLLCLFKASTDDQSRSDHSLYNSGNCNVRHLEVSWEHCFRNPKDDDEATEARLGLWEPQALAQLECCQRTHFSGFYFSWCFFFPQPFPFFTFSLWLECMKVLRGLNNYFEYEVEMENEWNLSVNFHS